MREELIEIIKAEGIGAGMKWMTVAGSAMAGNQAAKAECARLLGRDVETMGDYWQIMSAAREVTALGEMAQVAGEAQQALNAGKSAADDADAYLANRLGTLRREHGLTQQELSRLSGVGLSTLQKLENGANRLLGARTEIVLRLAKALGVTVEALAGAQGRAG